MQAYRCATGSAEATRELGLRLARQLLPGDVLLLTGELGAGKSELMRGLARGLGILGPVPSPTFTLLNLYQEGTMPFKHFDWYRVRDAEELYEAGLEEMVGEEGVTAIEWHERAPELLPPDHLEIIITRVGDEERSFHFLPRGAFRQLDWAALDAERGRGT
ncbi:MAG: tRNA (adenosine(37)-N6)-threonylcarbamoyltransferase complex ATPase subunit type 1 TsaE [Christensenellales bacterium]